MKSLLSLAVGLFVTAFAFGQDFVEYDSNENPTAAYWKTDDGAVKAEFYFANGDLKESGYFVDNKRDGEWVLYNMDKIVVAKGYFEQGKRVGNWMFYNDSGELTHEVSYDTNQLVMHKEE